MWKLWIGKTEFPRRDIYSPLLLMVATITFFKRDNVGLSQPSQNWQEDQPHFVSFCYSKYRAAAEKLSNCLGAFFNHRNAKLRKSQMRCRNHAKSDACFKVSTPLLLPTKIQQHDDLLQSNSALPPYSSSSSLFIELLRELDWHILNGKPIALRVNLYAVIHPIRK